MSDFIDQVSKTTVLVNRVSEDLLSYSRSFRVVGCDKVARKLDILASDLMESIKELNEAHSKGVTDRVSLAKQSTDFIKEMEGELTNMWCKAVRRQMHDENDAICEIQSRFGIIQCYTEEKLKLNPDLVHDELFENDPVDSLAESEIRDQLRNIQHAIENYFRVG